MGFSWEFNGILMDIYGYFDDRDRRLTSHAPRPVCDCASAGSGSSLEKLGYDMVYPLVICYIAMENDHL